MLATTVAIILAGSLYWLWSGVPPSSHDCPIPGPPIDLRVHGGSGELVFVTYRNTYVGEPLVSELTYELALYPPGADRLGPGNVTRGGALASLNTTGELQFHDMEAESEFSPGNDFFILMNPPADAVQLRVLRAGTPIAWNPLVGCI